MRTVGRGRARRVREQRRDGPAAHARRPRRARRATTRRSACSPRMKRGVPARRHEVVDHGRASARPRTRSSRRCATCAPRASRSSRSASTCARARGTCPSSSSSSRRGSRAYREAGPRARLPVRRERPARALQLPRGRAVPAGRDRRASAGPLSRRRRMRREHEVGADRGRTSGRRPRVASRAASLRRSSRSTALVARGRRARRPADEVTLPDAEVLRALPAHGAEPRARRADDHAPAPGPDRLLHRLDRRGGDVLGTAARDARRTTGSSRATASTARRSCAACRSPRSSATCSATPTTR